MPELRISNLNPEDIGSISIFRKEPLLRPFTGHRLQQGYFDYYEEGIGRETRGCFHFQCGFDKGTMMLPKLQESLRDE